MGPPPVDQVSPLGPAMASGTQWGGGAQGHFRGRRDGSGWVGWQTPKSLALWEAKAGGSQVPASDPPILLAGPVGSRPSTAACPPGPPVYLDLAYLPGGSAGPLGTEFFLRVRALCYVISGQDQHREQGLRTVLDALLDAKRQWDCDLQVLALRGTGSWAPPQLLHGWTFGNLECGMWGLLPPGLWPRAVPAWQNPARMERAVWLPRRCKLATGS